MLSVVITDGRSDVQERVKTFNNMAQAQMKLTAWDSALASVRQVRLVRLFTVLSSLSLSLSGAED